MPLKQSRLGQRVQQSEIRAMTVACSQVGGINMAQGVCDLDVPAEVLVAAQEAMLLDGGNVYTPCEGLAVLRQAIASHWKRYYQLDVDPEAEVLVSLGATGAFYAACLALLNPGDEVLLFEPFYGYHAATVAAIGCVPRFLRLEPPLWQLEGSRLEEVVSPRTKAIVLNTPSNPSGKVFSQADLKVISEIAEEYDLAVFSDEIYEHFVYDNLIHRPPASLPGLRDRTITISGLSKIFSITGWRLGYAVCPPQVLEAAAHFNDLIYVCAPAPLQVGAAKGLLELTSDYYREVASSHQKKRDQFCSALQHAGLNPHIPKGAYYVLADISGVPGRDDKERAMFILDKTGIACVPGRAFYHDSEAGRDVARFCFAKKQEILDQACERIQRLKGKRPMNTTLHAL